jgi:IS5 family transposase
MTTPLDKTLRRELNINGRAFIVALSPDGVKLTLKGRRLGLELRWTDLVNGEAALAVALNASVGKFAQPPATQTPAQTRTPLRAATRAAAPRAERGTKRNDKVERAAKTRRAPRRQRLRSGGR